MVAGDGCVKRETHNQNVSVDRYDIMLYIKKDLHITIMVTVEL